MNDAALPSINDSVLFYGMPGPAEWGPAMQALSTDKQRRFAWACLCNGGDAAAAARAAGYSDHLEAAKVQACRNMQNPKVVEAMRELATRQFEASALLAANVLIEIAGDKTRKTKDRLHAAEAILNRTGFAPAQTINVNRTNTDRTGEAMIARLKELAAMLGVDAAKLIGDNAVSLMRTIEHVPATDSVVCDNSPQSHHGEGSTNHEI